MAATGFWNKLMRSLGLRESPTQNEEARPREIAPPHVEARGGGDMSGAEGAKTGGTFAQANPPARKTGTARAKAKAKSAPKTARKSGKSRDKT